MKKKRQTQRGRAGRKAGIGKFAPEDTTPGLRLQRLLEGDALADLPADIGTRVRNIKAGLRGNLRERIRLATSAWKGPLGEALSGDVDWLLGEIEDVAAGRKRPDDMLPLLRGLRAAGEIPQRERDLYRGVTIALHMFGDMNSNPPRLRCSLRDFVRWMQIQFPMPGAAQLNPKKLETELKLEFLRLKSTASKLFKRIGVKTAGMG